MTVAIFPEVIEDELETILQRSRMEGRPEVAIDKVKKSLFGIALSGGGIRSATLNLEFLQVLNDCGILKKADYLSTISGPGQS